MSYFRKKQSASLAFFICSTMFFQGAIAQEDCGEVKFDKVRIKPNSTIPVNVVGPVPAGLEGLVGQAIGKITGQVENINFVLGPVPSDNSPHINISFDANTITGNTAGHNAINFDDTGTRYIFKKSDIVVFMKSYGCVENNAPPSYCLNPDEDGAYKEAVLWVIIHEILHSLGTEDTTAKNVTGRFGNVNNKANSDMKLACVFQKMREGYRGPC